MSTPTVRDLAALAYLVVACEELGIEMDEEWDRFEYGKAIYEHITSSRRFTADEVVQIANETSDSLGNLYRLDFIARIQHEATPTTTADPERAALAEGSDA